MQAALSTHHMGKVIRAYREHPHHGRRGLTQATVGEWAGISQGQLSDIERSHPINNLEQLISWALLLDIPQEHLWFLLPDSDPPKTAAWHRDAESSVSVASTAVGRAELLRQDLNDALTRGALDEASINDWEQTALRYGRATRDRPAGLLLADLTADLAELQRDLDSCKTATTLRRLVRVVAQMSGLMVLTLVKLDERPGFRRWARTARVAAAEAGDPTTLSWVLAQEAFGHYYSGDLMEAIEVAEQAQEVARRMACVGVPLAAALAARAHAALDHSRPTRRALARAENELARLDASALEPSAFGYNEAQLRFHEGNAYTHLHDSAAALRAQDRALELCAPGDYTDWAMTRLDRASCLAIDGDVSGAMAYALETLTDLTEEQRHGIILGRGQELVAALPVAEQAAPAARDLHELLLESTTAGGTDE
jgi:tetratricopeptide (TPR) repeat protein/DNA-binding XRE family transcriptional regulator